jgi:hypothetical protein
MVVTKSDLMSRTKQQAATVNIGLDLMNPTKLLDRTDINKAGLSI